MDYSETPTRKTLMFHYPKTPLQQDIQRMKNNPEKTVNYVAGSVAAYFVWCSFLEKRLNTK